MEDPLKANLATVQAHKKPPPEKPAAVWLRTKVILSFWAVIVFLGLPTWYKTTSIYRARLPLQEMLDLSEDVTGLPIVTLPIWIYVSGTTCSEVENLVKQIQEDLDRSNKLPFLRKRLQLVHDEDHGKIGKCGQNTQILKKMSPAVKVVVAKVGEELQFQFREPKSDSEVFVLTSTSILGASDLAAAISTTFLAEEISIALQINNHMGNIRIAHDFLTTQPQDLVNNIHERFSRSAKTSPTYHLTFSLFTASGAPSSWDVNTALTTHIEPLVYALQNTSEIKIATQVQLYSSFAPSIQTYQIEGSQGNFIEKNDLTAFVNAAEWPLSPSIGTGPTLNFILFVPPKAIIPLSIEGHESTSWMVPQWGGITILNPALTPHPINGVLTIPEHVSASQILPAFETFSTQLTSLLGIIHTDVSTKSLPLSMRLDAYQRLTAFTLYMKAASSLGSLARLAQHLSGIPIPKHVAQLVQNTMHNLTATSKAFEEGSWADAIIHASTAYLDSEKAFFDKSMVGQVYFPDEHKVAVYLPFLGPIGVPLLIGLLRESRRFVSGFRTSKS